MVFACKTRRNRVLVCGIVIGCPVEEDMGGIVNSKADLWVMQCFADPPAIITASASLLFKRPVEASRHQHSFFLVMGIWLFVVRMCIPCVCDSYLFVPRCFL